MLSPPRLLFSTLCLLLAACQESPDLGTSHKSLTGRPAPQTFLELPWGSGAGRVGHAVREEAASEGPMSLTVDSRGRLWVLDQLNARVLAFDAEGRSLESVSIGTTTAQDLLVLPDGRIALLDRLRERSLILLDSVGNRIATVPLVGNGVAEAAAATGLFVDRGGLGVEVESQAVVRLSDLEGRIDADRPAAEGRPSRSGPRHRVTFSRDRPDAVVLWDCAPHGALSNPRTVVLGLPIRAVKELATDSAGNIYLGLHGVKEGPEPDFGILEEREELWVLSAAGRVLARTAFLASTGPEEQFRDFAVAADGTVYHLEFKPEGARIVRWAR